MQFDLIDLTTITGTKQFCYHLDHDDTALQHSIQAFGVINPILAVRKNGIIILDGFRRFRAARKSGLPQIPAVIYPEDRLEDCFLCALQLNFIERTLTAVELLRLIYIAGQEFSNFFKSKITQMLRLANFPDVYSLSLHVAQLPDWMQLYFFRAKFSMKAIEKIRQYPVDQYESWIKMTDSLNFKETEFLQTLENIRDISLRDRVAISDIWNILKIPDLLGKKLTTQQKVQHLKDVINRYRFPISTGVNKKLTSAAKLLEKGVQGNLSISWDRTLENPAFYITFRILAGQSIDQFNHLLSRAEFRKGLIDMMNVMENISNIEIEIN